VDRRQRFWAGWDQTGRTGRRRTRDGVRDGRNRRGQAGRRVAGRTRAIPPAGIGHGPGPALVAARRQPGVRHPAAGRSARPPRGACGGQASHAVRVQPAVRSRGLESAARTLSTAAADTGRHPQPRPGRRTARVAVRRDAQEAGRGDDGSARLGRRPFLRPRAGVAADPGERRRLAGRRGHGRFGQAAASDPQAAEMGHAVGLLVGGGHRRRNAALDGPRPGPPAANGGPGPRRRRRGHGGGHGQAAARARPDGGRGVELRRAGHAVSGGRRVCHRVGPAGLRRGVRIRPAAAPGPAVRDGRFVRPAADGRAGIRPWRSPRPRCSARRC